MKILLLIFISIGLYAGTVYKTPNLVVEKSQLYCTDYYGKKIMIYPIGDIIDGERASSYCSYNKSTVEKIAKNNQLIRDEKSDKQTKSIIGYVLVFFIILFIYFAGKLFYLFFKETRVNI